MPFDAISATSGFCVYVKNVASGYASFLFTVTKEINGKKTEKLVLYHFSGQNVAKIRYLTHVAL